MKSTYHFPKKTVRDVPLHGKKVLVRADFNVPLSEDGVISSDYRVTQALPTLKYLTSQGAAVIIVSHLGRPEGVPNQAYTLAPVAQRLTELLPETDVTFVSSTIDDAARQACKKIRAGQVVLLENLRFNPGEEANDHDFAAQLKRTSGADYFVQDGFGVVHRAHASTEAITHLLPSVAGLLLEKEVSTLQKVMKHPQKPVVAIVGGAKISDKIEFIEKLLGIADTVLVGGAMANTFLLQQGHPIGKSKFEEGQEDQIATILQKAQPGQVILPTDVVTSVAIATDSQKNAKELDDVQSDDLILDLGPKTAQQFTQVLQSAATVIWNGTLGYAEIPQFAECSQQIADCIGNLAGVESVIGGGDTADFTLDWLEANPGAHFTHISTGGGASLELMSGMKLPGVEALVGR